MKKMYGFLTLVALLALAGTVTFAAEAATATKTVAMNAQVDASAKLQLDILEVNFADADPDNVPTITANSPIKVTAKGKTGAAGNITLTVLATALVSGSDTIPVDAIKWLATGGGFAAGTMGASAQPLGSWKGSGNREGFQTYTLTNSWAYATGTYKTSITYTLTAP